MCEALGEDKSEHDHPVELRNSALLLLLVLQRTDDDKHTLVRHPRKADVSEDQATKDASPVLKPDFSSPSIIGMLEQRGKTHYTGVMSFHLTVSSSAPKFPSSQRLGTPVRYGSRPIPENPCPSIGRRIP